MQDVSRGEGRTVLFVSHNMASIRQLCTTGLLLENGMVDYRGSIDETVNRYFCLPLQAVNETPIDAFFAINIFFEASPFKALAVEVDSDSISGAFFS
jgi:ABC-type multidrug transport system ATPase subunit